MTRSRAASLLGVTQNATTDELKKAFRRKAYDFHPDRNKSPDAGARFLEIQDAYKILLTPAPIPAVSSKIPRVNVSTLLHRPTLDVNSPTYKQIKGVAALFFGKESVERVEKGISTASTITEQSMREAFDMLGIEYEFEDTNGKKDR
jgi:hypothetical protein